MLLVPFRRPAPRPPGPSPTIPAARVPTVRQGHPHKAAEPLTPARAGVVEDLTDGSGVMWRSFDSTYTAL